MTARPFKEHLFVWSMRLLTYAVILFIAFLLIDITAQGWSALSWDFVTAFPERGGAEGGIFPAIVGTLFLVLGAIAVALPLGIASAVYLSEYATQGSATEWIRMGIITLAGVPSIVFGLFGLGFFVNFLGYGPSLISGYLTLACMILPTIIVACEESLRAVPRAFREASIALGASQWQTISRNVLPYALPGMLTGSILGIARAAGETAPILLTAVAFYLPDLPQSVFDQVMALPYHLYVLSTQHPELDLVLPKAYATAFVLLVLVLGMNFVAIHFRRTFRRKYQW